MYPDQEEWAMIREYPTSLVIPAKAAGAPAGGGTS